MRTQISDNQHNESLGGEDRGLVEGYAEVLDALSTMAFLANVAGEVRYLNAQWYRKTGMKRHRAIGEAYEFDLSNDLAVHPDDLVDGQRLWQAAVLAVSSFQHELRLKTADGSYRWVLVQANPLMIANALAGFLGTLTDVDEMHQKRSSLAISEERFRVLSELIPGILWTARPDGTIQEIMDGSMALKHGTTERIADWTVSVHPEDRQRPIQSWASAIQTGSTYQSEFRVQMADESYRWMLNRADAQRDEHGRITQWVGVSIDVDRRIRSEEQLQQFVADAGHELRTPLTVISGYIDMLRRDGFDDTSIARKTVASLAAGAKRMRALVEGLVTLATIENAPTAARDVVDVGVVLRHAIRERENLANTRIVLEAPEDLLILGESSDLYEVVTNLLENAVKYGARSEISVTATRIDGTVAVRVRDGGPGIAVVHRARIFDRFYRALEDNEVIGSGLGLAIATKAAARLGGRIELEDANPGSTTFALMMPSLVWAPPAEESAGTR